MKHQRDAPASDFSEFGTLAPDKRVTGSRHVLVCLTQHPTRGHSSQNAHATSSDQIVYDVSSHVGQPIVATFVTVGQTLVVDAQLLQQRGV